MYAMSTAAEILGVTTSALETALGRGETIASLTRACGLDLDEMIKTVVDAEVADVEAFATIAGFDNQDVARFVREMRAYLVCLVNDGEHVADALFDGQTLAVA